MMLASVGLLLAAVFVFLSTSSPARADIDARIRALPPELKDKLIETYAYSALVFSKTLKFNQPPEIYMSCPAEGCDPSLAGTLAAFRTEAPGTLGERAVDGQTAQIEIYVAPQASAFEARDREIDRSLRLNVNITERRFGYPLRKDAPCWTASYFDRAGVIKKALIYIDSDSSPRMQYLCMEHEIIRAAGVVNLESVSIYRKDEEKLSRDPFYWLAVNAYLHGLPAIKPGLTMEQVLSILKDRYGKR